MKKQSQLPHKQNKAQQSKSKIDSKPSSKLNHNQKEIKQSKLDTYMPNLASKDTIHRGENSKQQRKKSFSNKSESLRSGNSDISARSGSQQSQKTVIVMPNVEFYLNKRQCVPNGDKIDKIHIDWWNNYNLLQRHHGFIQWLFPNNFTSRFNSQSYALSQHEIKQFRNNREISKRYIKSYQMMLQFYGMKLKSKATGQLIRDLNNNFKERYQKTLITSFHNHMRITRILCSLTLIGFGRYAKQLSLFLKSEIHSEKGNLKQLAKYNADKDWKLYQDIQTQQNLNIFLIEIDKDAKIKTPYQQQLKNIFGEDVPKSEDKK